MKNLRKLEDCLIDSDRWDDENVPSELLKKAHELSKSGISAAIGHHSEIGWFGLVTGQGPFVFWQEN